MRSNEKLKNEERSKLENFSEKVRNEGVLIAIKKANSYLKSKFKSKVKRRVINSPPVRYLVRKKIKKNFHESPIIIGGCGRSGTTLLLTILGAHPHIYSLPSETNAFLDWNTEDGNKKFKPNMGRFYRYLIGSDIPEGATRWCEKSPRNVRHFGKILSFFENEVKIIHIVRDGRDVTLSHHPKEPNNYWVSPERWVNDVKAGLEFRDHPQVLTIKYENLIQSYRQTITKVCDFINEEFSEELEEWWENSNIRQDSLPKKAWGDKLDENKQLHTKSISKWEKEENKDRVSEVMQNEDVVKLLEELDYT